MAKCAVHLLSNWLSSFQHNFEATSFLWDYSSVHMTYYVSWGLYNSLEVLYSNWTVKRIFCDLSGSRKKSLRNQKVRLKRYLWPQTENLSNVSFYNSVPEDL